MEGVVSVLPNSILNLHTTRSWDFMGLTQTHVGGSQEGDVIIGLLDTGIWPEAESFSDDGIGPPPAKWKGICQSENNITCNNKLIGARYYNSMNQYDVTEFKSPRDSEGHGTHTASTAAGRIVTGASYYGLAEGVARGGVPNARIAMYKVCWSFGCSTADIFAAFDDAIADGVDIISVSLGFNGHRQYFEDPIAVGAFHAMKYGILTSNSAGNSGPEPATVANYSPWSLTVAASTIDRKFVSQVVLGNGQTFAGTAINSFVLNGTSFPLTWGGDAPNVSAGVDSEISRYCYPHTLNSLKTEGKIVLCDTLFDGSGVLITNGIGTIINDLVPDYAFSYPLPTTLISIEDGAKALDYIKSTENPTGTILFGETWKDVVAPRVVSFSSRGRNPITPDILKPDLTAPGVDILAAWSPVAPPSIYGKDTRSVKYNIISGTSMSCPHASGAAAYVKAAHPSWGPSAIKSALMTTASIMDPRRHEDAEFAYGSGHINPLKAVNPGLVFEAFQEDYADFLCNQGYNTSMLRLVTDGEQITGTFKRTVTNVGSPNSTYSASVDAAAPLFIEVVPSYLTFTAVGEKKTFTVYVGGPKIIQQPILSSSIVWEDGEHIVRTPLVVYTVLPSTSSPSYSYSVPSKKPSFEGSSLYHKNGIIQGGI
ncbi:Peptidase S8/S53 domain [Macleaya cordata]|uniref:Peptidase S8/S53 domain n=1 Tax=Macleaya cordata TaxID=56857 RepID=A0A200QPJ4_MACCD|nr:Peptidase S8/S53 domain [Macleaya cordata]